ncbi:hypothetical protein TWF481_006593 [Arthrobotrys musiformis]|uniref:Ankyrin n=1 Tax=Arthrobotrys musiformis TaxID=47236 RepID=A0AAV9W9Z5_9PEZI
MRLQYFFPRWLLEGMLSIDVRVSQCPEVLIKAWNIRNDSMVPEEDPFLLAFTGDLDGIKALFHERKTSVRDIDPFRGCSLLHWAISISCLEVKSQVRVDKRLQLIRFLMSQGADVNVEDHYNISPVSRLFLIERRFCTNNSKVPRLATEYFEAVRALLPESYIDYEALGLTRLHRIILGIESGDLIEELKGYDGLKLINTADSAGKTPLMWVASLGDAEATRILLEHGADITRFCHRGASVLLYADLPEVLEVCLKYFPVSHINFIHPNRSESVLLNCLNEGTVLLMDEAAERKRIQVASRLINAGANINLGTDWGASPLSEMASMDRPIIATFLLDSGADVNSVDDDRVTVLMTAVRCNSYESLSVILSKPRNFDFTLKDRLGWNILHYVAFHSNIRVLQLLHTVDIVGIDPGSGVDIANSKNSSGRTPTDLAIRRFQGSRKVYSDLNVLECEKDEWFASFTKLLGRVCSLTKISTACRTLNSRARITEEEEKEEDGGSSDAEYNAEYEEFHDAAEDLVDST